MKINSISQVCSVLLLGAASVSAAASKTNTSQPVPASRIDDEPYRFNGVVRTEVARGSGFCAWNRHTIFSAAHMVFDGTGWGAPPMWFPKANSQDLDDNEGIQTRGYFRWASYADTADADGTSTSETFAKDVILGFAYQKLIKGKPAKLNLNGRSDLLHQARCMITGYPAEDAYRATSIDGYFMHRTTPMPSPFKPDFDNALQATLITTGPGNSGGPVWTRNAQDGWQASGILVGGLPSESEIYAFSSNLNPMLQAAEHFLQEEVPGAFWTNDVGTSTLVLPFEESTRIPDGVHKWSKFRVYSEAFDRRAAVSKVHLSLDIQTSHRGDLQVMLTAPNGTSALVHNEQGAGRNNLIITDLDLSSDFAGTNPFGKWIVLVQDRLKGDIATFKSFRLEISTDGATAAPTPAPDDTAGTP